MSFNIRKILCIFIAAITVVCFVPYTAFSEGYVTENEYIVELYDGCDPERSSKEFLRLSGGKAEIMYIYTEIMNGFSVRLPGDVFLLTEKLDGVKCVYSSDEYAPCEYEGTDGEKIKSELYDLSQSDTYRGENSVVAILDSGFDKDSGYFALSEGTEKRLTEKSVKSKKLSSGMKGSYVSEKIPYAYDYGDGDVNILSENLHGQHIAGIIAGNPVNEEESTGFCGVAPEAQILLMKIFSDSTETSSTSAIVAAMEDAVKLGADVINMSFGVACGNSSGKPLSYNINNAIESAKKKGTFVICAAGNSGIEGKGSRYYSEYGIDEPAAWITDLGTVSSPASLKSSVAVGSYTEEYKSSVYFTISGNNDILIPYSDTCMYYAVGNKKSFPELVGTVKRFKIVSGLGTDDDFEAAGNLRGALALVRYRGGISLEEKLISAEKYGAAGVIFYCDEKEYSFGMRLNLANAKLPAILISYENASVLFDNSTKNLKFHGDDICYYLNDDLRYIAEYSSSGANGDVTIKPDVIDSGTNIRSLAKEGFTDKSGTSMAAAKASGTTALIYEYRRKNGLSVDTESIERLIMNSAVKMTDSHSGYEYSPRRQGAGAFSFDSAVSSFVSVSDSSSGKAKVEISEDIQYIFNFELDFESFKNTIEEYSVDVSVMSDSYYEYETENGTVYFNSCISTPFKNSTVRVNGSSVNVNTYSGKSGKYKFKAEPNYNYKLKFVVFLDAAGMSEYEKIYTNGFYIEGFVNIYDKNGNVAASVPYAGFHKGKDTMPALDYDIYEFEKSFFGCTYLYSKSGTRYVILGGNGNAQAQVYNKDYLAFSPNGDGVTDELYLSLGLLRNLSSLNVSVTDKEGNEIHSCEKGYIVKSYWEGQSLVNPEFSVWDGKDKNGKVCAEGEYTVTVKATGDFKGAREEVLVFPVRIDTEPPEIENAVLRFGRNGNLYLEINVSDGHSVQSICCCSASGKGNYFNEMQYIEGEIKDGDPHSFMLNITYMNTDSIFVFLNDFAQNTVTYKYDLTEIYASCEELK